jgi:hypothetical protein
LPRVGSYELSVQLVTLRCRDKLLGDFSLAI